MHRTDHSHPGGVRGDRFGVLRAVLLAGLQNAQAVDPHAAAEPGAGRARLRHGQRGRAVDHDAGQAARPGPAQVRDDDGPAGEELGPDGGDAERGQITAQAGRRAEHSGVRLLAQQAAQDATPTDTVGEDGEQGQHHTEQSVAGIPAANQKDANQEEL
uniref:(northern house mosquito) hypothetical protein n=1 Tax=Culex pipiens TaxID=7175 RepID=A0A8D8CR83_CULPI